MIILSNLANMKMRSNNYYECNFTIKIPMLNFSFPKINLGGLAQIVSCHEGWQATCENERMNGRISPSYYVMDEENSRKIQNSLQTDFLYREKLILKNSIEWGLFAGMSSFIFSSANDNCKHNGCNIKTAILNGALASASYVFYSYYGPVMLPLFMSIAMNLHILGKSDNSITYKYCHAGIGCAYHALQSALQR